MSNFQKIFLYTTKILQFLAITILFSLSLLFVQFSKARSAEPQIFLSDSKVEIKGIQNQTLLTAFKEPKKPAPPVKPRDQRAIRLEKYLAKKNIAFSKTADLLIELSDKYGISYKLIVAIAGLESGYCDYAYNGYNCWGYGRYSWKSASIAVREYYRLMNENYFSKGARTIQKIAPVYAPSSNDYLTKYYIHYNQIP